VWGVVRVLELAQEQGYLLGCVRVRILQVEACWGDRMQSWLEKYCLLARTREQYFYCSRDCPAAGRLWLLPQSPPHPSPPCCT